MLKRSPQANTHNAANSFSISSIYGYADHSRRTFTVADIHMAILGAVFLSHYHVLVDFRGHQLEDGSTGLTSKHYKALTSVHNISATSHANSPAENFTVKYHRIMQELVDLTQPDGWAGEQTDLLMRNILLARNLFPIVKDLLRKSLSRHFLGFSSFPDIPWDHSMQHNLFIELWTIFFATYPSPGHICMTSLSLPRIMLRICDISARSLKFSATPSFALMLKNTFSEKSI